MSEKTLKDIFLFLKVTHCLPRLLHPEKRLLRSDEEMSLLLETQIQAILDKQTSAVEKFIKAYCLVRKKKSILLRIH